MRSWLAKWCGLGRAQKPTAERWSSRGSYLAVAVAVSTSAVLLWRFPALALEFGGGTFLIAYAIALALFAFPLLILEAGLGQRTQRAAPRSLRCQHKRLEWLGWTGTLLAALVLCLHVVVAVWALVFGFNAMQAAVQAVDVLPWDADPGAFLHARLFGESTAEAAWSLPRAPVLLALFAVWGALALAVVGGPRRLGVALRLVVTLVAALLGVFVVRMLLLAADPATGAVHGLDWALHVEASALGDVDLWIAAVAHSLLAYGLGLGVHVALAAGLPREADVGNNARLVGLVGASATLIVFLAVACLLGSLALHAGRLVADVSALFPDRSATGIGVTLLVVPQGLLLRDAVDDATALRALWSACWFLSLAGLALAAAAGLFYAVTNALREKWPLARWRIVGLAGAVGLTVTVVLLGVVDWSWFDVVDYWIVRIAVLALALATCIVLGWVVGIRPLRRHIDRVSEQPVSLLWEINIRLVAPLLLVVLLVNAAMRLAS